MRRLILAIVLNGSLACGGGSTAAPHAAAAASPAFDVSDAALVKTLPGFERAFATVNGVRLHYVAGGAGDPVVLLPGWPETWWAFHKVMPALASRYRVIAVDLRGMGASDKPAGGYDKKTMAKDIQAVVRHLGVEKAHIVGHDIGAQVAFAVAANHPESTWTVTLLDVPHPDEELAKWPLLPTHGTFGDKIDERHPYAWWFAFHQVRGLPEQLLEGRAHLEHEWFFRYLLSDETAIDARDRAVYAAAYSSRDAIRAGNAWYQAFSQDILDDQRYAPLTMPVLGLGGPGYEWLKATLARKARDPQVTRVENSGHFIMEEQPEAATRLLVAFLSSASSRSTAGAR